MTAMADTEWEIVIRDPAADENIHVKRLTPKELARFAGFLPLDLQSEFTPEYMVTAIFRRVPDPEEAARIAAERLELNRLAAKAGQRVQQKLKEQGYVQS